MSDQFRISVSILSSLERDEISRIVGVDADRYSPAGAVMSPWRTAEQSVWQRYPPMHTADLNTELARVAEWVSEIQVLSVCANLTVTVIFAERGRNFFPVTLQGAPVRRLLQLGATLDFDDVLSNP